MNFYRGLAEHAIQDIFVYVYIRDLCMELNIITSRYDLSLQTYPNWSQLNSRCGPVRRLLRRLVSRSLSRLFFVHLRQFPKDCSIISNSIFKVWITQSVCVYTCAGQSRSCHNSRFPSRTLCNSRRNDQCSSPACRCQTYRWMRQSRRPCSIINCSLVEQCSWTRITIATCRQTGKREITRIFINFCDGIITIIVTAYG